MYHTLLEEVLNKKLYNHVHNSYLNIFIDITYLEKNFKYIQTKSQ